MQRCAIDDDAKDHQGQQHEETAERRCLGRRKQPQRSERHHSRLQCPWPQSLSRSGAAGAGPHGRAAASRVDRERCRAPTAPTQPESRECARNTDVTIVGEQQHAADDRGGEAAQGREHRRFGVFMRKRDGAKYFFEDVTGQSGADRRQRCSDCRRILGTERSAFETVHRQSDWRAGQSRWRPDSARPSATS